MTERPKDDIIYLKDGDIMQCTSVSAFNECITPRSWNFPNITRPFSIIYYVLGGSAYYKIDGEEYRFEKGHIYVLPANKVFSLREDPSDKFYSVYVHAYTFPEIDRVIDANVMNDQFLFDTVELLRKYVRGREQDAARHLVGMLLSYLTEISSNIERPLSHRIKSYVEENFVEVFKDSSLSSVFNYSNSYLVKIFKNEFDLTPKQYAEQLILKESVILLGEGLLIGEISDRLKFSSPENFSRFFKGFYGCPPTIYAKRFIDFPI